uniref:Peptidase metallopeptidase domain-containing protein n=1 Tax=Parascaris univalens TaxID=6257 RepID=A0A915AFX0_PARUN
MALYRQLCLVALLLSLFRSFHCRRNLKPLSDAQATKYLSDYGYVSTSNVLSSAPSGVGLDREDTFSSLKNAIRKFQEFARLRQTGELDDATRRKMAQPRCGVTDVLAITKGGPAFKWNKKDLTYSIESFSPDLPQDDIRRAMAKAFATWSAVAPLNFEEVRTGGDIKIRFASRFHGDPWPFDGEGGVLAHATMPPSGLLHFDEDEHWVYMDPKKIFAYDYMDLLAVAIHESGHTLGLDHSRDESSIMAPFYQETVDAHGNYIMPKLNTDDITKIQNIYGPRRRVSLESDGIEPTARPSTGASRKESSGGSFLDRIKSFFGFGGDRSSSSIDSNVPSHGSDSTDSGFHSSGTESFSGSNSGSRRGSDSSPHSKECPKDVDGITTANGITYLFSGSKVYQLASGRVENVHSLRQLFPKSPAYVQGALTEPRSGVTLLFQHGQVYSYTYDRSEGAFRLDSSYPKRLSSDIKFNPMGAFMWIDGREVLVNAHDFAIYDHYWNKGTLQNKISNYFDNFPNEPIRGAIIDGNTVIFFANDNVYRYDVNQRRVVGGSIPLYSYLNC